MVSPKRQAMIWGVCFILFALMLWFLGETLLPFMLGAAIAYFLDPVADRLEAMGLSRLMSTVLIAFGAVILFVLVMVLIVPAMVGQIGDLVEAFPGLVQSAQEFLIARVPGIDGEDGMLQRGLATVQEHISQVGPELINTALASSLAVVDFVVLLVVAPVVAFYLLLDWDRMVERIDELLPREHAPTIRRLAKDIDRVLAGFVRGQVTVCLILGTFYAIGLTLIGLPYGFLVGMVAGLLSFIPYVGSLTGGILSIGIAVFSFWETPVWIAATVAIFAFGQFFEGNILSPKLIGKSVGLHPVLLILALAVFGSLFGFAGMLVAVPVAAALGVLGRFLVGQYQQSPLYMGRDPYLGD